MESALAEGGGDNEDRTEEASDERRTEFRERGDIAISRDITQVFTLAALMGLFATYVAKMATKLQVIMYEHFHDWDLSKLNEKALLDHMLKVGGQFLELILPLFVVVSVVAIFITLSQTRLNWSWKKIAPKWERMNPIAGLGRMVSMQAVVEVLKAVGKMTAIFLVSFLILKGEMRTAPGLMNMPFLKVWNYWADISHTLIWSVLGLLMFIGAGDFLYSFISMEKKLKMTKEEVKEEYKKREQDPHMKNRMKRMQREIATSKTITSTKTA
ncbi:MAG: EscU/YscU/HrcU family type III secretion system export apparatus switch protein, partial [Proteobacteria bacterium]